MRTISLSGSSMDDHRAIVAGPPASSTTNNSGDIIFSDNSNQQLLKYMRREKQHTGYPRRTKDPSIRSAFPRARNTIRLGPGIQEAEDVLLREASDSRELKSRLLPSAGKDGFFSETENISAADAQNLQIPNDSPNVPKHWGRRGRQRNIFLREIESAGETRNAANVGNLLDDTGSSITDTNVFDHPEDKFKRGQSQQRSNNVIFPHQSIPPASSTYSAKRPAPTSKRQRSSVLDRILQAEGAVREVGHPLHRQMEDLFHEDEGTAEDEDSSHPVLPLNPKLLQQDHNESLKKRLLDHDTEEDLVAQRKKQGNPNTPLVSGAWVQSPSSEPRFDTKVVNDGISRHLVSAHQNHHLDIRPNEPIHPKSVLEAILGHKTGQPVLAGEDTLNSLRDILDSHDDLSMVELSAVLTTPLDEETLMLANNVTTPLSKTPSTQTSERKIFRRMDARLKAVREGLKHASRGMERVEDQFEALAIQPSRLARCSCCDGLNDITLSRLLLRAFSDLSAQFYMWPRGGPLKLTKLGFCALLTVIWYFTEVVLCDQYCHKDYATYMVGYGVDINAPSMPWVTVTLFVRLFKWLWAPIIHFVYHVFLSQLPVGSEAFEEYSGTVLSMLK